MLVAAKDGAAAVLDGKEVDYLALVRVCPVRANLAINAESRNTAIRIDVQAQVRARLIVFHQVPVMHVTLEFYRRQQFPPAGGFLGYRRLAHAGVDRSRGWIISREVTRVDVEAAHDSGNAEPNDAMIMSFGALAAGLPAIHPLAVIVEFAFDEHRLLWLDQSLFCRKEFIGREHDPAAESRLLEPHPCTKRIFRFAGHDCSIDSSRMRAIL